MTSFFSLLLTCALLLQGQVMAASSMSAMTSKLESAVKKYNSLTKTERQELFQEALDSRPAEDRKAVAPYAEEIKMMEWNDLKLDGHQVSIQIKDQTVAFNFLSVDKIEIDGRKLEIAPGQLKTTFDKLQKKSASVLLELFITYAHAEIVALVLLLATFVAVAVSLVMGVSSYLNPWDFQEECGIWKGRLSRWNTFSQEVKSDIEAEIHKYNSALIRRRQKLSCPSSAKKECDDLQKASVCFQDLNSQIEKSRSDVNDNGRGYIDENKSRPKSVKHPVKTKSE